MLHIPAIAALAGVLLLAESEPEKALRRAVQLQQDGDLKAAIQQYQAVLAQNPDLAEARVKLGNAYASSGRYSDAVAHYEKALESGGLADPAGTRYALGWAYFRIAGFERAKQVLVQVVADGAKGREALHLLASCHFNLGEWRKVIGLLSPLEAELSESPALTYLLGVALEEDGQMDRGTPLVESALRATGWPTSRFRSEMRSDWLNRLARRGRELMGKGDYPAAARHLERAIELDSGVSSLNGTYGKLLRLMVRHDDADRAFQRELEINPGDYDANLYRGIYLFENEQKYEDALVHFERALRTRPGDADARFQMGLVHNSSNRIEEAIRTINGLVEEHPNFLEGHVTLAGFYFRLGRTEEAERHRAAAERLRTSRDGQHLIKLGQLSQASELFERQKQADPSDPVPYYHAGIGLWEAQDWGAAAAEFKEAVRLGAGNLNYAIYYSNSLAQAGRHELARTVVNSVPGDSWRQLDSRRAWILGDTYFQLGEYDEVLRVLELLAERDPRNARVDLMRGQIHLRKGGYEQARAAAEASIRKQPGSSLAHSLLATARYLLGDMPGAKVAFLRAVEQDPGNPDHLRKLGALYLEMGEVEAAIRTLERARSAAADSSSIRRLLERAYGATKTGSAK